MKDKNVDIEKSTGNTQKAVIGMLAAGTAVAVGAAVYSFGDLQSTMSNVGFSDGGGLGEMPCCGQCDDCDCDLLEFLCCGTGT
eukprot:UN17695